jgi:hypothetical protein
MASNIANEIAAKVAGLPPERQREALALIEQLAARSATTRPHVPRAERKLKGATAQGISVSDAEIRQSKDFRSVHAFRNESQEGGQESQREVYRKMGGRRRRFTSEDK